jgi:2-dehydro-3-deoxyphosphogluconate aldolase/(4S)-4-hydroxy-2-oxoglutarate aldolase
LKDGFILVFNKDQLDVVKTAEALKSAGINNMEVTCRISKPLDKVRLVCEEVSGFKVGVASLIDSPEILRSYNKSHPEDPLPSVDEAVDAGAGFLVSAGNFRKETYEKYAGKIPLIPGCGTVSEILKQFSLGANLAKVFPARQLGGPGFVKAIDSAIHKTISLVPTGGTRPDNIPDYIDAGVLVVGGSFSAVESEAIDRAATDGDYETLEEKFASIKSLIDECRRKRWPGLDLGSVELDRIMKVTGRDFNVEY